MWFDSWPNLGRVLLTGLLVYVAIIVLLRASGKRTLSKMNAFDFIVTVALGSTFASTILSDTPLAEGIAAIALLIGLQYAITWASVRWQWFQGLVKSQPSLIFYQGEYLKKAMLSERVTTEEIRNVARDAGYASMKAVAAVVLESDGSFTVLGDLGDGLASSLANVGDAEDRMTTGTTSDPISQTSGTTSQANTAPASGAPETGSGASVG